MPPRSRVSATPGDWYGEIGSTRSRSPALPSLLSNIQFVISLLGMRLGSPDVLLTAGTIAMRGLPLLIDLGGARLALGFAQRSRDLAAGRADPLVVDPGNVARGADRRHDAQDHNDD
jgi:hypothetical protein